MLNEKKTGPVASSDGAVNPARIDRQGASVVTEAHGEYNEATVRDNVFIAATQAEDTWTVALAAAYTGLIVSNPAGSNKNLSILKAGMNITTAPVGIASIHLAGGYAAGGIVTYNAIAFYNMKLGSAAASVANVGDTATLVGTPIYLYPLIGGFTAAALFAQPAALTDIGGSIVVPPGAYVCIVALTVALGFGCIVWEEIPI